MHDATVGQYRALRELTPQPSDDVIESRDRQATASRNRTPLPSSLRHRSTTADDAAAEVVANQPSQSINYYYYYHYYICTYDFDNNIIIIRYYITTKDN